MKLPRFLVALTVVNLVLLAVLLARARPAAAHDEAPVLRGRALELVDETGKVRASIRVYPADPDVQMPDGRKGYPETVLLRLITRDGRPSVKLSASERGGILVVGGESNPTYAQLMGDDGKASMTLVGKDGQRHTIEH